jgi:hypothetical protein
MSFRENLLKKIQIDRLVSQVLKSLRPPDSGLKLDKEAMRSLLKMSPYAYQKKRDLDLYIGRTDGEHHKILVLDNELPIYQTTVEDVALRKSPHIKEMASIRNIIKILKDSDVKISIKDDSVKTIQNECIDLLDLSYTDADIEKIAEDGSFSLENGYAEGIKESLILFSELLNYQPAPKAFRVRHHEIMGALNEKETGEIGFGPLWIFSLIDNQVKLIEEPIHSLDEKKMNSFQQVVKGHEKPTVEGTAVFHYLKKAVLKNIHND